MSRTTRKPKFYIDESDVAKINQALDDWHRRPTTRVRKRKNKDEYAAEMAKAESEYQAEITANGGNTMKLILTYWPRHLSLVEIHRNYVFRWKYETVELSYDDVVNNTMQTRAKMQRDGCWTETSRNTGYKGSTKRELRRRNKEICRHVIAEEDFDAMVYPIRKEGKSHVWDWW
jgi:hypothetical protein